MSGRCSHAWVAETWREGWTCAHCEVFVGLYEFLKKRFPLGCERSLDDKEVCWVLSKIADKNLEHQVIDPRRPSSK
jgi:hypothetical protein